MNTFEFLKIYLSPFKRPKLKFYFGKVAVGVPFFLPRRWKKYTKEEAQKKAQSDSMTIQDQILRKKISDGKVEHYVNSKYAVPKKIGFDFCGLGWKTKWGDTDYRFEWEPKFSFVFFGLQFAITFHTEHSDQYWTSWLFYTKNTTKTDSIQERVFQMREKFPQNWIVTSNGETKNIDYYDIILKPKYRKDRVAELRNEKLREIGL